MQSILQGLRKMWGEFRRGEWPSEPDGEPDYSVVQKGDRDTTRGIIRASQVDSISKGRAT